MQNSSYDDFVLKHIGPSAEDTEEMLHLLNVGSMDELIDQTIPSNITTDRKLDLPPAFSEYEYIKFIREVAGKNSLFKSYMGLGYYNCIVP
ncbi:MAG: hypothetical protein ACR2NW_00090, partial [Thermodesulfobacteriota bacterium]